MRKYRCYVVYRKGHINHPVGKERQGPEKWVDAPDKVAALRLMHKKHVRPRKEEHVVRVVATPWKEDRALRELKAKELPLNWD